MFGNLIKITRPGNNESTARSLTKKNSIILTAFEGNLIKINSIKSKELSQFLGDLEELNEKLEILLIELYKSGEGGKLQSQYDKILSNLQDKHARLNYLSSFFETTKKKIEAAQQKIMECEKKLIDDEARKRKIDNRMEKLMKKHHRRPSKFKQAKKLRNSSSWVISNWQTSMRRRVRSGHEITVTIESPTESLHSESSTIILNDDDKDANNDEEDNWSDITLL